MGNPGKGRCTYCLTLVPSRTWDHVIPAAWYPDSTPPNVDKWKVPACRDCNKALGVMEEDILLRCGLCLGPEEARAAGIAQKALRIIQPQHAKSDRDRRVRQRKRAKIRAEMIDLSPHETRGIMPGFGMQPHWPVHPKKGILIPIPSLKAVVTKIVRGVTFLRTGQLIGSSHHIGINFVNDKDVQEVLWLLEKNTEILARGPGVLVERRPVDDIDDVVSGIFRVTIWGRFRVYAVVAPVRELRAAGIEVDDEGDT